jgi:hypothetical protein
MWLMHTAHGHGACVWIASSEHEPGDAGVAAGVAVGADLDSLTFDSGTASSGLPFGIPSAFLPAVSTRLYHTYFLA